MKRALLIAIGLAASTHVITRGAGQLASGRNVNLHPGIADQYVGDIYLQRKVEPKVVCSSTNTLHCVAIPTITGSPIRVQMFRAALARRRN